MPELVGAGLPVMAGSPDEAGAAARSGLFHGMIPPMCTPLTDDGEVDSPSVERLVDHLLRAGMNGLFALGSTGEVAHLTDRQRRTLLRTTLSACGGQQPVLAGAIETTTPRVIEQARMATQLGAAAIVVTAPFYLQAAPTEVLEHYRRVRAAVDVPIVAYNIPSAVGYPLDYQVAGELAAEGTICGLKDSGDDFPGLRRFITEVRGIEGFSVFTGHTLLADVALFAGANGVVSGLANADPDGHTRLYSAAQSGDWMTVRREQSRLEGLYQIITIASGPGKSRSAAGYGASKAVLKIRGIIDSCRLAAPLGQLSPSEIAEIAEVAEKFGLLAS